MSIKDQLRAAILSGGATGASPGTLDTSERPFLLEKGSRSASRSQGTSLRPVFASGFIGLRAEPNLCFGGASHG